MKELFWQQHCIFMCILILIVSFQSHPACRGPDTVKSVFNIHGQSPLVAHFLRMKNLSYDAGQVFRVQRTEQENLPPYPFNDSNTTPLRKAKIVCNFGLSECSRVEMP